MDFRPTSDQQALRATARRFLAARFPRDRLRRTVDADAAAGADDRLDRGLWRALGEAGFFSLRLPEKEGGAGLGMPEAVLVFEEAGRALVPGPMAATHVAAGLVPGAADGAAVVTALDGPGVVEHLASADAVLLTGGPTVHVLPAGRGPRPAPDLPTTVPLRPLDPTTPLHRIPGPLPGDAGQRLTGTDAQQLRLHATLLTAAQQLGSAARTLDMAVEHARNRKQFGRPIGAFQAVQHVCSRMLARTDLARSGVYAASVTMTVSEVSAAKLLADEAAVRNARDCLQLHGGMGFSWEADVHLHLKRAWVRREQWQPPAQAEELLALALLDDGGIAPRNV
ncbi:hypothetical protein GCM10010218_44120 [Streptomyces mashuensis]|uniref:Acyl-CoA dehydrogenase n=1 Tax=Streptomyces mashuensis TaxID=33904 RepID=A0A919B7F4_9ACTN|nr:acyl-CoA dehydrogenase family protein [Streptomyces mashuensis]GHF57883.1 hypothetical protein GCM10010218_44120 [Streptomyces mashuensis]